MDKKEAEARPLMGTIFLVLKPFVLCVITMAWDMKAGPNVACVK